MSAHTPGPWVVAKSGYVHGANGTVAVTDTTSGNGTYNEMLEVLRDIRDERASLRVMMARIETIIAKAEGRS